MGPQDVRIVKNCVWGVVPLDRVSFARYFRLDWLLASEKTLTDRNRLTFILPANQTLSRIRSNEWTNIFRPLPRPEGWTGPPSLAFGTKRWITQQAQLDEPRFTLAPDNE